MNGALELRIPARGIVWIECDLHGRRDGVKITRRNTPAADHLQATYIASQNGIVGTYARARAGRAPARLIMTSRYGQLATV